MDNVEVRAVIKYFCKKGMSLKEIHDFIKILGDEYPSYSTLKKWATECRRGREGLEDYEKSGHPKEATTDEKFELVQSDHVWQEKPAWYS